MLLVVMVACSDDPAIDDGSLLSAGSSSVSQSLSSGSESSGSASSQSVPDTEKPVVTLNNLAHGDTVTVSPFFLWGTVTDNSGSTTVYVRLDAAGWQSIAANSTNAWSASLTLTSVGSHSLSWYARDAAGNSTTTNSLTFTYDSGAPTLTISTPPNGGYSRAETLSVGGTASAPAGTSLTTVEVKLDAAAYSAATSGNGWAGWSWGPVAAAEGVRTLTARATAANGKTAEKSVSVTVDRTRPTAGISAPASTGAGTVTLTLSAADSLSGIDSVRILRDGFVVKTLGPTIPATTTISMLTQGSYTLGIAATDKAGNVSLTNTAAITVYAAPSVAVTAPASSATVVTSPFDISGTASVAGGTITNVFYKFGSSSFAPVNDGGSGFATWSKSVTPSAYGNQTLTVRAYGNMGQYSETSRSFVWDPIRPLAGFVSPLDGSSATVNEPLTVTITNSDVGTGVKTLKLALNGTVIKTWSNPAGTVTHSCTFDSAVTHKLEVWAEDAGLPSLIDVAWITAKAPLVSGVSSEWYRGDGTSNGTLAVSFTLAETADVYIVVVDRATPPTAAQIIAGVDYTNVNVYKAHADMFDSGAQSWSDFVSGLTAGVANHIYLMADDGARQSRVMYGGSFKVEDASGPAAQPLTSLIFSEYIEGGGDNKVLEIYNGTGYPVQLDQYTIELYKNGSSTFWDTPWAAGTYGTILQSGQCYVFVNSGADPAILAKKNKDVGSLDFNGDDAILLRSPTGAVVDVIGQIGYQPAAGYWGVDPVKTQGKILRRKKTVTGGRAPGTLVFDPATEWNGYATINGTTMASGLGSWQE